MKLYFIGILGKGLKPLAELAKELGEEVAGSDRDQHLGDFLLEAADWVIYSSAIPADHPELRAAERLGKKCTKRAELINQILTSKNLRLLAVAGTHGKTTTTAMLIWACQALDLPVSYLVGSNLPWAGDRAGHYDAGGQFLIYEADEYDRNFLNFHPAIAGITTVTYDHHDIYPTEADYQAAFQQFREQSSLVLENVAINPAISLVGEIRRQDASLALAMLEAAFPEVAPARLIEALNRFPGVGRRFESIAPGVFSDYAHHPNEVAATVQMALELAEREGKAGVVAVYEPLTNARQLAVRQLYRTAFNGVTKLYWLPTFLAREPAGQAILQPADFIADLDPSVPAEPATAGLELADKLRAYRDQNYLVLLMLGNADDSWVRLAFAPVTL